MSGVETQRPDDWRPVMRALISVSDKSGLEGLAACLAGHGVELVSTGGTAMALRGFGHDVREVADITGWPEMLDGRVKTLHPRVHGGLLARREVASHQAALAEHAIPLIDLLVVDLYPFEQTRARTTDFETILETIDIGGPALIRAAGKNHADVAVLTSPADYPRLMATLAEFAGGTRGEFRRRLAAEAYARTAAYDAAIAHWLAAEIGETLPARLTLAGRRVETLRYGENPLQEAALYATGSIGASVVTAKRAQGKDLSYNNIADADAAFELVCDLPREQAAVAIVKHANPCGAAMGTTALAAYRAALASDPVSAFGGIVAVNRPIDGALAAAILELFTEVVIAPAADQDALDRFKAKPNVRLLLTGALPDPDVAPLQVRTVRGGLLVQTADLGGPARDAVEIVTRRQPSPAEWADLMFAFRVAKHVKSNAIVLARDGATLGIGAGQPSRIDATDIAIRKAGPRAASSVVASDAFYPFADGVLAAAAAGVTAVIQPGGSVKDAEIIAAADAHSLAMIFTGRRHFRH